MTNENQAPAENQPLTEEQRTALLKTLQERIGREARIRLQFTPVEAMPSAMILASGGEAFDKDLPGGYYVTASPIGKKQEIETGLTQSALKTAAAAIKLQPSADGLIYCVEDGEKEHVWVSEEVIDTLGRLHSEAKQAGEKGAMDVFVEKLKSVLKPKELESIQRY